MTITQVTITFIVIIILLLIIAGNIYDNFKEKYYKLKSDNDWNQDKIESLESNCNIKKEEIKNLKSRPLYKFQLEWCKGGLRIKQNFDMKYITFSNPIETKTPIDSIKILDLDENFVFTNKQEVINFISTKITEQELIITNSLESTVIIK